jgi:hypothetical protein
VVLAAVFVPAMYWIGRGRHPLGDPRRKDGTDEHGDAGSRVPGHSEHSGDASPPEREDHPHKD